MKAGRSAKWAGVAATLLLLAVDVSAQAPHRPMRERNAEVGGAQRLVPAQSAENAAARDESTARGARLSPEERRQLRRDVHEAGRDLYPDRERLRRRGGMRGQ